MHPRPHPALLIHAPHQCVQPQAHPRNTSRSAGVRMRLAVLTRGWTTILGAACTPASRRRAMPEAEGADRARGVRLPGRTARNSTTSSGGASRRPPFPVPKRKESTVAMGRGGRQGEGRINSLYRSPSVLLLMGIRDVCGRSAVCQASPDTRTGAGRLTVEIDGRRCQRCHQEEAVLLILRACACTRG